MALRHVMILMSAVGAFAALLMAMEYYQRLKEAAQILSLQNLTPASDSILQFGMSHVIGLATLGILFLALLLVMIVVIKDPKIVATLEGHPASIETAPVSIQSSPLDTSQVPPESHPDITRLSEDQT
jgi:hypothetical protein